MASADLEGSKAKNADVSKNNTNVMSYHYLNIKKNKHPKLKRFFFVANHILSRVFRGFELNSSLAQSDGELLLGVKCTPEWLLREQNFGLFLVYES